MGLFDDLISDFKEIGDELSAVRDEVVSSVKDIADEAADIDRAAKQKVNEITQKTKKITVTDVASRQGDSADSGA